MFSISKCQCCFFKFPNFHKIKCSRLGFHLGARKSKVATKTISCESYREILFQKVASGYLLHFVQDGSSKKRTRIIWGSLLNYRHPGHGAWEGGLRPAAPDSTSPESAGDPGRSPDEFKIVSEPPREPNGTFQPQSVVPEGAPQKRNRQNI